MTTYVVTDIETVENEKATQLFAQTVYKPAANLKDPLKIEQSILERRQKDMDQAALHWWTGKIVCLCANIITSGSEGPLTKPLTIYGDDEKEILSIFFDRLEALQDAGKYPTVIGKSSEWFDKPYMVGRALAHDLGVPAPLRTRDVIHDVDHMFSYSSQCDQRSTLANYAFGLGVDGKLNHSSAIGGIYAQIQMGEPDKWKEIGAHCEQDTAITTTMLKRWMKAYEWRRKAEADAAALAQAPNDEIPFGP